MHVHAQRMLIILNREPGKVSEAYIFEYPVNELCNEHLGLLKPQNLNKVWFPCFLLHSGPADEIIQAY